MGLDLPWGAPIGFERAASGRDTVAERVLRYLRAQADTFAYLFISWQPRDRNVLDAGAYFSVYDDLFERAPDWPVRALHQTTFNLGALERYDRAAIVAFTNALVERYGFAWVNEDLGLWSLNGRPLPYPLPPFLTDAGLRAAIRNTTEVQQALAVPLLVEFPGFSEDVGLVIGDWHAYDFLRVLAEETGSPVTLDVGHLLSYQWVRGMRGEALYAELDRLPLAHCFEIHLSGCAVVGDRFMDYHHGILLDEQLELLRRLATRCPNLHAITYEDPRFDDAGALVPDAVPNFGRLQDVVRGWAA